MGDALRDKMLEFIAVTIPEFLAWYRYGEIRLMVERFVSIPVDMSGHPVDRQRSDALLSRAPHVPHDEEQSLVIARMRAKRHVPSAPAQGALGREVAYEPILNVQEFIPLTVRASRLL